MPTHVTTNQGWNVESRANASGVYGLLKEKFEEMGKSHSKNDDCFLQYILNQPCSGTIPAPTRGRLLIRRFALHTKSPCAWRNMVVAKRSKFFLGAQGAWPSFPTSRRRLSFRRSSHLPQLPVLVRCRYRATWVRIHRLGTPSAEARPKVAATSRWNTSYRDAK